MDPTYVNAWSRRGNNRSITVLKFSPDGHYLASGGGDGYVYIYSVLSGELLYYVPIHSPFRLRTYTLTDFHNLTAVLTGSANAPGYAIDVSGSGRKLALGVGSEVHVAMWLRHVLPNPNDLYPEIKVAMAFVLRP
ncbi:hypothetical protein BDQ17DRAFT_1437823 [Cyathus striatus]|nr:hypothetical protein BDQ17DRAFT_1437823 [Cyathus striatus]